MRSRLYRKIASLLGLLAILMVTLAPTVSQTLAAARHGDSSMASDCDMASMPSMQHDADDDKSRPDTTLSDGQACGYCSLLAHVPVVPGVPATFAVTSLLIQLPVATRFESARLVEPLASFQPRAPPTLS